MKKIIKLLKTYQASPIPNQCFLIYQFGNKYNITLDVDAPRSHREVFSNDVIHLGDFDLMKGNIQVYYGVKKIVSNVRLRF